MLRQSSVLKGISATLLVAACCSSFLPVSLYLLFAGVGAFWLSGTDAAQRD